MQTFIDSWFSTTAKIIQWEKNFLKNSDKTTEYSYTKKKWNWSEERRELKKESLKTFWRLPYANSSRLKGSQGKVIIAFLILHPYVCQKFELSHTEIASVTSS